MPTAIVNLTKRLHRATWFFSFAAWLAACSGGGVDVSTAGASAVKQYAIGVTVTGLAGSGLVLQNNDADNLLLSGNGSFNFATPLVPGDSYSVTVLTQPSSPTQACTVTGGSGTVTTGNITNINLVCVDKPTGTGASDLIGGTLQGLLGSGLVLQDNLGDNLGVAANGSFTFATPLAAGAAYSVSILSPPIDPYQNCAIANGAGTTGASDVLNVVVSCRSNPNPTYTIGGSVTGISAGSTIVLEDNGRDSITLQADGSFQFHLPIPSGSSYSVTSSATGQQSQACAISNASGTVAGANIANVVVTCVPNTTISATISGLAAGNALELLDNGTDSLTVTQNGTFNFASAVAVGSTYRVTVATQPTATARQTCVVQNGTGVAAKVTTPVVVRCATTSYTVGGIVAGLAGTGLVLQDNGGNNLPITANGAFTFSAPIAIGSTFNVTVLTQPTARTQTCTVAGGAGTIAGANVTSVAVSCTTNTYTVGGTVTGLLGTGLVLQDNGGNNLTVGANGPFTFTAPIASGATYSVAVLTQPATPTQTCTVVGGGTGTIGGANVTTVAVSCTTNFYTVGGTVTGLLGSGLVLQDNGGNNLTVGANGPFKFTVPIASGATYSVAALTQPATPTQVCTVTGGTGTGTITNAPVTSVAITCVTSSFNVGGTTTFGAFSAQGLVLQDNLGTPLAVTPNAGFNFGVALSGSQYSVTIATQPTGYACAVTNGVGTVTNAAITNISVSCSSIGGYLYVANGGGNSISGFAIDANSGALQPLTQVVAPAGQPNAIVATTLTDPNLSDPSSMAVGCPSVPVIEVANKRKSRQGASQFSPDANPPFTQSLYVANAGSSSVSAYSVNTSTSTPGQGSLSLINSLVTGGTTPTYLDFDYFHCTAYSVDSGTDNLAVFGENRQTGMLTQIETPVAAPVNAVPVAAANADNTVGVDGSQGSEFLIAQTPGGGDLYSYQFNAATGDGELSTTPSEQPVATTGIPAAIAATTVGQFPYIFIVTEGSPGSISSYQSFYFENVILSQNTVPTGNGSTAINIPLNSNFAFVVNGIDNTISSYDFNVAGQSPGTLVNTATSDPLGNHLVAIASANPLGVPYLYVVDAGSNNVYAYKVNTNSGALTYIGTYAVGLAPTSIAIPYVVPIGG